MEIWKDIPDYEGFFQASNLGNIRRKSDKQLLRQYTDKKGYKRVYLTKNHIGKTLPVHRLVYGAFFEKPMSRAESNMMLGYFPVINHKDENPSNNNIKNLELITTQENILYSVRLHPERVNQQKKKVYQYDLAFNLIKKWDSGKDCAANGYSGANVCCINKYGTFKFIYKGYIWSHTSININKRNKSKSMMEVKRIEQAVCDYYKVDIDDLYSRTRRCYPYGIARDILMYLLFSHNMKSYKIAEKFGFATTMVYRHCATIQVALKSDTKIKQDIEKINEMLNEKSK